VSPDTVSSDRFAPVAGSPFKSSTRPVNFGPAGLGGLLQAEKSAKTNMMTLMLRSDFDVSMASLSNQ
jgi:hypothetical protein